MVRARGGGAPRRQAEGRMQMDRAPGLWVQSELPLRGQQKQKHCEEWERERTGDSINKGLKIKQFKAQLFPTENNFYDLIK